MTDTDTTTQAQSGTTTAGTEQDPNILNVAKTDAADAANAAETKVETAVDAVKADVTSDASGVGKALSADAADVKTEASTLEADVTTDIEIAKAHAQAALTHIEASGFVSTELTKAKNLLAVVVAYIEKHI